MPGDAPGATAEWRRRTAVGLALAVLVASVTWTIFVTNRAPGGDDALVGFPLDDAWIHLVYARSLANEGGFHYNVGEPESGMTSPLWVVLAAGAHLVAAPFGLPVLVVSVKLLALLFGVASVVTLWALARALGLTPAASLLAALLAATDPAMTFTRAAGMEVPLFTFLLLAAFALVLRGELLAAATAAGLMIVARPEGVLVVPAVALLAIRASNRGSVPKRRVVGALLALCLPAILWVGFNLVATGRALPNTFYAKFAPDKISFFSNLTLGWRDYVRGAEPYFVAEVGAALALVGAAWLVARRRVEAALVFGSGVVLFAATLGTRVFSAGHFHYFERWLVPSYPFLLLAMVAGIEAVSRAAARLSPSRFAGPAVAALLLALLLLRLPTTLFGRAEEFAWNCRNIEEMNVPIGNWIASHAGADEAVATADAGAIRYLGERRTIDLLGLNDHRIKAALRTGSGADYLGSQGVRWFVLFPKIYGRLAETLRLEPVESFRAERYTISGAPQDEMVVYRWRGVEAQREAGP